MTSQFEWDTSTLPASALTALAVLGFCPVCYAVVPTALLDKHHAALHEPTGLDHPGDES